MKSVTGLKTRVVAFSLLALGASFSALAATIPFSSAGVAIHDPALFQNNVEPYFAQASNSHSGPPTAAASSLAFSGDWGAASAMASADLTTGQLRGRASGNLTGLGVYQYNNIYSQTNAYFGDGFRAYNTAGTPFTWQSGTTARFGITVGGTVSSSPSLAALPAGLWVSLLLFQHDTLNPNNVFGVQPNMIGYYHYLIGNPNLQVTSFGPNGNLPLLPTAYLGTLGAGPVNVVQDFTPNGNFDWVLLLGAYGNAYNPGAQFNLDLSHTVTFNYQGPAGTTTQSVSGLFNNYHVPDATVTVPEPSTLALMVIGLMGFGFSRRRKAV